MERWNDGTMERWNDGTMERWNDGTMERWNDGMMEFQKNEELKRRESSLISNCRAMITQILQKNGAEYVNECNYKSLHQQQY
jgi:hypothetical protein